MYGTSVHGISAISWDFDKCLLVRLETWEMLPSCYSDSNLTHSLKINALLLGLLAKKAIECGLSVKPYIKTSLSPGSGVVTYYLKESGVMDFLSQLG